MCRFRALSARVALLLGLVAWLVASGAERVHAASAVHAVCAEHGETVEVAHGGDAGTEMVASAPDPLDAHDDGCVFDGVVLAAVQTLLLAAPERDRVASSEVRIPGVAGPRAPPLTFAPKTSPPA